MINKNVNLDYVKYLIDIFHISHLLNNLIIMNKPGLSIRLCIGLSKVLVIWTPCLSQHSLNCTSFFRCLGLWGLSTRVPLGYSTWARCSNHHGVNYILCRCCFTLSFSILPLSPFGYTMRIIFKTLPEALYWTERYHTPHELH